MWSSCSASCGSGKMTRFRACTNPAPSSGGSKCAGPNAEEKSCLVTPCLGKFNCLKFVGPLYICNVLSQIRFLERKCLICSNT